MPWTSPRVASKESLAALKTKMDLYTVLEQRERCQDSLMEFIKHAWPYIDSSPFQSCFAIQAMAEHLEAVTYGYIPRLLINVPPRCAKTSVVSIIYPAWVWSRHHDVGPLSGPQVKFLCASYSDRLTLESSNKFRRLVQSDWYQKLFPQKFMSDQNTKGHMDNDKGGTRISTSVGGTLLGLGGDVLISDDLNNTEKTTDKSVVETGADRLKAANFFDEFRSTRRNNPKEGHFAVIGVQQRVNQKDMSGHWLDSGEDLVHLCLPMRHDPARHCVTVVLPQYDDPEPWEDPRDKDGYDLMWPERFGEFEVAGLEKALGPFLAAGRLQQSPTPKGGGIIQRAWWQPWDKQEANKYGLEWDEKQFGIREFPPMELVVASLDTAFKEKEENDFNALTIWGIFLDTNRNRRAMLMYAWNKRLPLHGKIIQSMPNELPIDFQRRKLEAMGLVDLIAHYCKKYSVKRLLIEDKSRGHDVANELRRLYNRDNWGVQLVNPVGDKVSRAHSIVPLFTDDAIFAPDTKWAEMVIEQCSVFPKAAHDDLCFVAGTLIATNRGNIPIECIKVGDRVLTPFGFKRVVASAYTGEKSTITRVGLSGTENHPVYVLDKGFVPLDSVSQFDLLSRINLCDMMKTRYRILLNLTESLTDEWEVNVDTICPNQNRTLAGSALKDFMWRFGNFITTRLFRPVTKSTTRTATHLISSLITLNAYRLACIDQNLKSILTRKSKTHIWHLSGIKQRRGTGLQKALLGIVNTLTKVLENPEWLGIRKLLVFSNVPYVEGIAKAKLYEGSFAPTNAAIHMGTDKKAKNVAPVYNITVEDAQCYYANGLLVHNCDSICQFLIWARDNEIIVRADEASAYEEERATFKHRTSTISEQYGVG